jgi:hypothetical protein
MDEEVLSRAITLKQSHMRRLELDGFCLFFEIINDRYYAQSTEAFTMLGDLFSESMGIELWDKHARHNTMEKIKKTGDIVEVAEYVRDVTNKSSRNKSRMILKEQHFVPIESLFDLCRSILTKKELTRIPYMSDVETER